MFKPPKNFWRKNAFLPRNSNDFIEEIEKFKKFEKVNFINRKLLYLVDKIILLFYYT